MTADATTLRQATVGSRSAEERFLQFKHAMNPRGIDLGAECPQLNAAPLFGSGDHVRIGFPDVHPSVSMWGRDTYLTGWVNIGERSAVYPGCNFMGDALMPMTIGRRVSLQHVELHYSGFRLLNTTIGDDTFMSHLAFAHSVRIGSGCYILGHVTMYDGAEVGDDVFIEGNSTVLGSARLRSGWAYEGRVERDTRPMCRTSEVVFGIDPRSGRPLYIGGPDGVARTVNESHLDRNANQMRLVALKHGYPERGEPARAVTIPHVFQSGAFFLALAAIVLEHQWPALAEGCRLLCGGVRAIYHGEPAGPEAAAAWADRRETVERSAEALERIRESRTVPMPPLERPVLQETADLVRMASKLREFDAVMREQELARPNWLS